MKGKKRKRETRREEEMEAIRVERREAFYVRRDEGIICGERHMKMKRG